MLTTILIYAVVTLVVGLIMIGIGIRADSVVALVLGTIIANIGGWTAGVIALLLLIKIAFPGLGA